MSELQTSGENNALENETVVTDKYELICTWLKSYTPLNKYLYFNVTPFESSNVSVNSVSNDKSVDEFIDGTKRVEFLFSVNFVLDYEELKTDLNLRMNEEFIALNEWVETQDKQRNYPAFVNAIVEKVEPLTTTPIIARDTTHNLAKYSGDFKITYTERRA